MALQSMTGFGRAAAELSGDAFSWELKSVNGKTLEARLRLPPGFERLEQAVRQAIQKAFARGNIQASLTVSRGSAQAQPVINETLLRELAGLTKKLENEFGAAPATADGLLALRGVLEQPEQSDDAESRAASDKAILSLLGDALVSLKQARLSEGAALGALLETQIDQIAELTAKAEADPSREPEAIRARLAEQVRVLLETGAPLDESRLHMEAAFLATKADIREELDRLRTHIASARSLLSAGGTVGRKLDFLSQEFNRESNTLCSKSNAGSVTALGLELKSVIDQFREQVQNLE